MSSNKDRLSDASKRSGAAVTLAVLMTGTGITAIAEGSSARATGNGEKQVTTTQGKFYCNIKALTPAEHARHKQLGDKIIAARKAIVETEKGYEFQFGPQDVTLAELADWVVAESKCCPFFNFHIDLENEGKLICLRLTGEEGIKAFIRGEFGVDAPQGK